MAGQQSDTVNQGETGTVNKLRVRKRARRRDAMALLAASRAALEPPRRPDRARAAEIAAAGPAGHSPVNRPARARRVLKRPLLTAGVAVMAAGVAAAVLVSALPGAPAPTATGAAPAAARAPRPSGRAAQPMTAREVLLAAAAHVARGPVTGRYWRVTMIGGVTVPGGTAAHPYDISLRTYADQWNPSSAGRKAWLITRQLGARPAAPADAAAWRAAGSPSTWRSGRPASSYPAGYPVEWNGPLAATARASARSATWQLSDGTVGFVEGDLAGLNAAQFGRMPTRPRRVEAILRRYARHARCGNPDCSTVHQLMWAEALMLLQNPVSAPVRSATFKVMAGLPGVRLIGKMTDPLGRPGYAIAPGPQDPNAYSSHFNPTKVVMINPQNGSLLATAEIGPMPRTLHCLSFDSRNRCTGPAYDGRSYTGQVDDYAAIRSEGWTNASPVLPPPSRRSGNGCCAGLPPLP